MCVFVCTRVWLCPHLLQPPWQRRAVGACFLPLSQFPKPALAGSEPLSNKKFTSLNDTHPTVSLNPLAPLIWRDIWKRRGLTEPPLLQEVTSHPLPPWRAGPAWQEPRSLLKKRGLRHLQVGCMKLVERWAPRARRRRRSQTSRGCVSARWWRLLRRRGLPADSASRPGCLALY